MSSLTAITNLTNVAPEKKLAAGMIAEALEEARRGDIPSTAWLEHCALDWLSFIVPDTVDAADVHRALLATLPARPAVSSYAVCRLATQLDMIGLEAA